MSGRGSLLGTEPKGLRNSVAHLHSCHEAEQVGALVGGKWLLVFAQHIGHVFQGETKFIRVGELGDKCDVFARESVVQANEEAVQFPADLFVGGTIHLRMVPEEAHSHAAVRNTVVIRAFTSDNNDMTRVLGLGRHGWLYVIAIACVALTHAVSATTTAYLFLLALGLPLSLPSYALLFMAALLLDSAVGSEMPSAYGSTLFVVWWTVTAWLNALLIRGVLEQFRKRRSRHHGDVWQCETALTAHIRTP